MSKYHSRESDIYLPGTAIPKNRLGIEDANLLQQIEASLLQQAYQAFIAELYPAVRFDERYFKSLHDRTFTTLYDWAGEYRSVDMSKGGSLFCLARNLDSASRQLFQQLEKEGFLKDSSDWNKKIFSERLAFYQSELIALHPFYELNGRITRLFFDLIAIYNGYDPIDYSNALENDVNPVHTYILASIDCVQSADNALLQGIIFKGLRKMGDSE